MQYVGAMLRVILGMVAVLAIAAVAGALVFILMDALHPIVLLAVFMAGAVGLPALMDWIAWRFNGSVRAVDRCLGRFFNWCFDPLDGKRDGR
jgi:hypothetical protein